MLEEFKNAFHRYNNGHVQLIIINVVVFLCMAVIHVVSTISGFENAANLIIDQFVIPPTFAEFVTRPWTLITYAFAHSLGDIFHILFNMLVFYWFGRLFIEYLGSDKLIATYILGALAGGIIYLLVFNLVPYFVDRSGFSGMVGASAAVYAVVVAIATLIPDYTLYLMFLGPVRIKYIAAFYIVISLLGTVGTNAGGNIAHLGGALMGFIYTRQLQAGVNWGGWITSTLQWFKDLFKPRPKVKVTYRSDRQEQKKAPNTRSNISQAELDAILDKISAGGYESLTKDEKEKLFNASKK